MFTRSKKKTRVGRSAGVGPVAAEVEIAPRHLRVGGGVSASWAITGYPAEVGYGWMEPLLTYPGRLDVSLHIEPIPAQTAAARLRRQMSKLEASSRTTAEKGKLEDFEAEVAAEDAREMAASLARGEGKLFRVGLYFTVTAASEEALAEEVDHVRSLTASMLLDARPASYRQLQGWISALPLGVDLLQQRRSMDTHALAASFPARIWPCRPATVPCCTGSTPPARGWWSGTGGRATTTTAWFWPVPGRASPTSANSTCSARSTPG
jgi:hypothetical protein